MVTYEDILRYLNSEMPDIGGIFSAPVEPDDDGESAIPDQPVPPGLTPEQLALLYGRGDGDDRIRGKFDTVGDLFGKNRNTYPNKMDIPANIMKRKKGYDVLNNTYQEILSTRDGPVNGGQQNNGGGASDIADKDRGGYATDDTAGFF